LATQGRFLNKRENLESHKIIKRARTTNYLSYIEAVNNTSCDVRIAVELDDEKKKKKVHIQEKKGFMGNSSVPLAMINSYWIKTGFVESWRTWDFRTSKR
jgi:hypothetical protein